MQFDDDDDNLDSRGPGYMAYAIMLIVFWRLEASCYMIIVLVLYGQPTWFKLYFQLSTFCIWTRVLCTSCTFS